jgi:hypothetical protein
LSYVERAKSLHARGEVVRAAVVLSQGLRRDPSDADALEWLLHLYVEEVPGPGLEEDLLRALERAPNGGELLGLVSAELEGLECHDKLNALRRRMDVSGIRLPERVSSVRRTPADAAPEPALEAGVQSPETSVPGGRATERWDAFDSPLERAGSVLSDGPPDGSAGGGSVSGPVLTSPSDLGTFDTLPEELRSDYLEPVPVSLEPSTSNRTTLWIALAIAFVLIAVAVVYATVSADVEEPATVWEQGEGSP